MKQNYSLSGAFHPLSKLIVCVVMLRGRHRGLPVAIDRAVVLPFEFEKKCDENDVDYIVDRGNMQPMNYADNTSASLQSQHPDDDSLKMQNISKQKHHHIKKDAGEDTPNEDQYDGHNISI